MTPNNNNEASSMPRSSSLSVQDLVIQRQRQLLLKQEKLKLTSDQQRLFLITEGNGVAFNSIAIDSIKNNKSKGIPQRNYHSRDQSFSSSPTSVIKRKTPTKKMTSKMEVAHDSLSHDCGSAWPITVIGHQEHQQHQQHQQQQQQQQYQHQHQQQEQQRAVDFSCLYPRDDQRSRVRFSHTLSVYAHCEDDDDDDDDGDDDHDNCGEVIRRGGKSTNSDGNGNVNDNNEIIDDRALFLVCRARRCWYSKEELRMMKDERKSIIRMLKKANFDARFIDMSMYDLRGLEPYYLSVSSFLYSPKQ